MYYAKYTTVSLNLPSKVTQQNPMFFLTLHVKKPTSKGEESAQARSPCKIEPRSVYLMPEQHTFRLHQHCVTRQGSEWALVFTETHFSKELSQEENCWFQAP